MIVNIIFKKLLFIQESALPHEFEQGLSCFEPLLVGLVIEPIKFENNIWLFGDEELIFDVLPVSESKQSIISKLNFFRW